MVEAKLIYPTLRLDSPAIAEYHKQGRHAEVKRLSAVIGREIASGLSIDLTLMDSSATGNS